MAAELPISAKDLIRYTPPAYPKGDPSNPVYLIAVPTGIAQSRWQRDVTASGAVEITPGKIGEFIRDAANALLEGAAREGALATLERIEDLRTRQAQSASGGDPFTDQDES